jgi:hypothetical protein
MPGGIIQPSFAGFSLNLSPRLRGISFVGGGGVTAPQLEVNGKLIWLRPEELLAYNNQDPISTWTDHSGNGNNGTTGGTQRPLLNDEANVNAVNNHRVVAFATGYRFLLPDLTAMGLSGSTGAEVFLVVKAQNDPGTAGTGNGQLWKLGTSSSSDHYPFQDGKIYMGALSDTRKDPGYNPVQLLNVWHVLNVSSKTNEHVQRLNGIEVHRENSNTFAVISTPVIGLAAGGGYFTGWIAEFILFDHVLTTQDRDKVGTYLARKYNLPVSYSSPPEAPTSLVNTAGTFLVDGWNVILSWNDNSLIETQYEVWTRESSTAQFTLFEILPQDSTSKTYEGIFDTQAQIVVVAKNNNGYSDFSNIIQTTPPAPDTPTTDYVSGLSVNVSANYSGIAEWIFPNSGQPNQLGGGFTLQRRVNGGAWDTLVNALETAYYVDDLTGIAVDNDTVGYRFGAANLSDSQMHFSSILTFTVVDPLPAPGNVRKDISGSPLIRWDDLTGEIFYEIERNFERGTFEEHDSASADSTSVSASGYTDADFSFRARGVSVTGPGEWGYCPPSDPANLDFANDATTLSRPLFWTRRGGTSITSTGITIQRKIDSGSFSNVATGVTDDSYTDTEDLTVNLGQTVYYRVKETSTFGDSGWSDTISGTILAP